MKSNDINLIELFGGICGFSKGIEEAGFNIKNHYYSEIDKHACANTKYNYPNAKHIGSVKNVRGERIKSDIIAFGSPCQDFSLAGKRKGMEGQRSSLILEAIRLISEIKPSVFVWENVKGTFSSNNGADFWAIINAFTNIGGYRLEWQLLNTSWLLPQNRERIYLVGHLTGKSKLGIFPFTENDKLFIKKERPNPQQFQTQLCSTISVKIGMRAESTFITTPSKAGTLTGGGHSGGLHSDMTVIPVITPDRKQKRQNGRRFKENGDPAFTLNCQDQHEIMINQINPSKESNGKQPFQQNRVYDSSGKMPALNGELSGRNNIYHENQIRRLTEIECERLQGFPDDWTKFGIYDGVKKPISKTQRYKLLGNAVTVAIVKMIFNRIELVN